MKSNLFRDHRSNIAYSWHIKGRLEGQILPSYSNFSVECLQSQILPSNSVSVRDSHIKPVFEADEQLKCEMSLNVRIEAFNFTFRTSILSCFDMHILR